MAWLLRFHDLSLKIFLIELLITNQLNYEKKSLKLKWECLTCVDEFLVNRKKLSLSHQSLGACIISEREHGRWDRTSSQCGGLQMFTNWSESYWAASHLSSRKSCKDKNFLQSQDILRVKRIFQSQENIWKSRNSCLSKIWLLSKIFLIFHWWCSMISTTLNAPGLFVLQQIS